MQPFTFFISYRRQDTAPIALLLKNEIEKRLQFVRVSVDVEEMKSGDPFPERLRQLIDGAHATIVLIGKQWMPRRGEAPPPSVGKDWVAEEIAYSNSAPIALPEVDRLGLARRELIPLFADCDRGFAQFDLPPQIEFLSALHGEHIDYAGWPSVHRPAPRSAGGQAPAQEASRHRRVCQAPDAGESRERSR